MHDHPATGAHVRLRAVAEVDLSGRDAGRGRGAYRAGPDRGRCVGSLRWSIGGLRQTCRCQHAAATSVVTNERDVSCPFCGCGIIRPNRASFKKLMVHGNRAVHARQRAEAAPGRQWRRTGRRRALMRREDTTSMARGRRARAPERRWSQLPYRAEMMQRACEIGDWSIPNFGRMDHRGHLQQTPTSAL